MRRKEGRRGRRGLTSLTHGEQALVDGCSLLVPMFQCTWSNWKVAVAPPSPTETFSS
jgi:hypothetical protein